MFVPSKVDTSRCISKCLVLVDVEKVSTSARESLLVGRPFDSVNTLMRVEVTREVSVMSIPSCSG